MQSFFKHKAGMKIATHQLQSLFKDFRRKHASRSMERKGTCESEHKYRSWKFRSIDLLKTHKVLK